MLVLLARITEEGIVSLRETGTRRFQLSTFAYVWSQWGLLGEKSHSTHGCFPFRQNVNYLLCFQQKSFESAFNISKVDDFDSFCVYIQVRLSSLLQLEAKSSKLRLKEKGRRQAFGGVGRYLHVTAPIASTV